MYDVITIGSATIDVFADIDPKFKQINLGDKVLIKEIEFQTGGGGINPAVALSRMELNTAFLGKLGHDHNAFKIIHELKKEDVNVIKTAPSKKRTSYSVIVSSKKEKDRVLFTYKGASDDLRYDEIKISELDTKWIYLATMLKRSFRTAKKIAGYAKKNNINLLFNPSTYLAKQGKRKLKPILDAASIIILNKSEAGLLLKSRSNKIKTLAKGLYNLGPKIVVITEGSKGVAAYDGSEIYTLPAYNVKVKNTTGAGDAFASGFLAGIIKNQDIPHALKLGNANSASVVQYFGTKNKLLTYKEATKFIKKRKENVITRRI
ncbi:carbohydrate kinase family protein [Candidatus Woesearchaeota archaeon]|nr:carbohydrate kinase family protein [Candidatus Woesearchaeota archaeon]